MNEFITLSDKVTETIEVIERSKFISYSKGVADKEEALEFVAGLKKKYYDATHVCYAFVVGDVKRYSDDGEPQGTAGMPILDVITKRGLDKVCVAVVRYFGGIKLGAGGLTRAYSGGAAAVVNASQLVRYTVCRRYEVKYPYSFHKTALKLTEGIGTVDNTDFAQDITLTVTLTDKTVDYSGKIVNASSGKVTPSFLGEVFVPVKL